MRAARSRRRARSVDRIGRPSRERLCGGEARATRGNGQRAYQADPCSRKAAGFCLAGAVRGMRSGDRGSRRFLPALLVEDRVAWKFGLQAMWVAACGHRNRQLWPVPGAAAAAGSHTCRSRLRRLPRSIALKLKYGRKVALARTMARYMVPLKETGRRTPSSFRCRCTAGGFGGRGFNQWRGGRCPEVGIAR